MNKLNKQYSVIAPFYDKMMNHVDYQMWANYLQSIFQQWKIQPRRIIDLSCGTAKLLKHLSENGWKLFGSDLSYEMLRVAQRRFRGGLFCSDLKALPLIDESFDTILVMYDTMNYILSDDDLQKAFSEFERVLMPGGWLIFDIVTPYICEKSFRDYYESDFANDQGYERRSWFISESGRQYNEFTIWKGTQKSIELHQQNIRGLTDWLDFLERSPFNLVDYPGDFTLRRGHEKSDRIHFICHKKD